MKQKLKRVWKWLQDNKVSVGMSIMLTGQGIQVFTPELMPPDQIDFIQTLGAVIGGFGLMHRGAQTKIVQKLLSIFSKPKKK